MEQYVIKGGNPLSGEVNIIGATECGAGDYRGCYYG